jgi:hypothetical protein
MGAIKSPVCARGHIWSGTRPSGANYCKLCNTIKAKIRRNLLKRKVRK